MLVEVVLMVEWPDGTMQLVREFDFPFAPIGNFMLELSDSGFLVQVSAEDTRYNPRTQKWTIFASQRFDDATFEAVLNQFNPYGFAEAFRGDPKDG